MLSCVLLGHRYRFTATGSTMNWSCARGCGAGGSKQYPDAAAAARYAQALDQEDSRDIGRRAPVLGMFPLRLWRLMRRRR
ncbi:MAG TPA: hypothetical protein VFM01_01345 [Nakamurella sp.]|nr:hypothetical protein [Nakamurella sp.]